MHRQTASRGPRETVDAVIVGGGHHGLVAAALLARQGWDVLLLEANDQVGGAVASHDVDGWVLDSYSACHPLAAASPVLRSLELESHGLRWSQAPAPVAHLSGGGRPGARMEASAEGTAALLEADHPGDGEAWLRLTRQWARVREPLLRALLTQWPPSTTGAQLLGAIGMRELPDLLRFLLLPVTRMGEELFGGTQGRDLLSGNSAHADIPPEAPLSGLFGWLLTMLAQDVGFPSPQGGTRELARALRSAAEAAGACIETGQPVARVVVQGNRAIGVETQGGRQVRARRAVVADTSAPALYQHLLPAGSVPPGLRARLEDDFTWDLPTVKLDYRLSARMPWRDPLGQGAGVVHAGHGATGLVRWSGELGAGGVPDRPFVLVGQMSTIDPSRSPQGTEAMWAYTHLPRGVLDAGRGEQVADGVDRVFDDLAPGWRDLVLGREVHDPADLEAADANLGQGAVGGGTSQLFQQGPFRPVLGLGGPRTHLDGLYLGSAATHPGGGVHGGCGHLAAQAALADATITGGLRGRVAGAGLRRFYAWPPHTP